MATKTAQKRLTLEYKGLVESPTAYIEAHPNESNILEWYYIITGPPDTPYAGGQYMGTLTFPADYPFNPPAIRMITPSGRFEPGTRLCLSISDYHPKTWNPSWSVSTILIGLLSFMTGEEHTSGSISTTAAVKLQHAAASRAWNASNARFREQYPGLCEEHARAQERAQEQERGDTSPAPAPAASAASAASSPLTWAVVAAAVAAAAAAAAYKIL